MFIGLNGSNSHPKECHIRVFSDRLIILLFNGSAQTFLETCGLQFRLWPLGEWKTTLD